MWEGPQMGVGMINTVLFMAVIFWNIVPHRSQAAREEKQGSWCSNFSRCVCCLQFILFTWTTLAGEQRLLTTFVRIVGSKSAPLRAAVDLFVSGVITGSYLKSRAEVSSSAHVLWKHLCEKRSLPLFSSIFLPSASLSLSIIPLAYRLLWPRLRNYVISQTGLILHCTVQLKSRSCGWSFKELQHF